MHRADPGAVEALAFYGDSDSTYPQNTPQWLRSRWRPKFSPSQNPNGSALLTYLLRLGGENHTDFEKVVCVILDINLGHGSGIELRHGLKAAGISVPVIYITANDSPTVRMAALQSGCLAYLTKPFSTKSLIEPLRRAWAA